MQEKFQEILKAFTVFILSLLVVGGYVYDIYMVLNGKIEAVVDPQKSLMVGQALGNLQGMASIILAFYFGATQSNKDKDKMAAEAISKIQPAASTTTTTISNTTAVPTTPTTNGVTS